MVSTSNDFKTNWGKSEAQLFFAVIFCWYFYFFVPCEMELDDRLQHLPAGGNGAADCLIVEEAFWDSLFL